MLGLFGFPATEVIENSVANFCVSDHAAARLPRVSLLVLLLVCPAVNMVIFICLTILGSEDGPEEQTGGSVSDCLLSV